MKKQRRIHGLQQEWNSAQRPEETCCEKGVVDPARFCARILRANTVQQHLQEPGSVCCRINGKTVLERPEESRCDNNNNNNRTFIMRKFHKMFKCAGQD